MAIVDKEAELFKKFIVTRKILIADSSSTARAGVANVLTNCGARGTNISLASSVSEAEAMIVEKSPDIVLAEYDLGKGCGLELLQSQRASNPDTKNSLFLLLTSNTSQTAVARAAEEDCDAFVIKPFTPQQLRQTIIKTALFKIHPSEYFKAIEAGKALITAGDMDGAEKLFLSAIPMDTKPALAYYYLGQIKLLRSVLDESQASYQQGLNFNKIHYKCMVGLFELLMQLKQHKKAYEVVKKVSQYFPANPKRLTEVLRLAIINKEYDDVEKYYQVFTNIDTRNDNLVNYICAALVVCGKYYLQSGNRSRALELYQKAAVTSAGRVKILKEIVQALIDERMMSDATKFLTRFPPDTQSALDYLQLEFQIANAQATAATVIAKGRDLIQKGIISEKIYEIMLRRAVEAKSQGMVDSLLHDATQKFPDKSDFFNKIITEA